MERLLSNDRLIAMHRHRYDVEEFPEDKLNIAYQDNAFNQFLIHLNNTDLEIIKKVIKEISNRLQLGDEVYKYSIQNPMLLKKLFEFLFIGLEKNISEHDYNYCQIRILSSYCFKQFCMILSSKEYLNVAGYLKTISNSFQDSLEEVKINVYQGLIYFSKSRYGIDILVKNNILEEIISRLKVEKSEKVIHLIFTLLNELLYSEGASLKAIFIGITQILKEFLIDCKLKDQLLEDVIQNLASLSLCEEGKKNLVEEGEIISFINNLLRVSENLTILISSTRFLKSVSILKRAKVEIFEKSGIDYILQLLDKYSDENLILNILQIISNVAEEPRCRIYLNLSYLNYIDRYLDHPDEFISTQAKLTKDIITWKP